MSDQDRPAETVTPPTSPGPARPASINLGKLLNGSFALLFMAVLGAAAVFFVQMYRDITALRVQEKLNQQRLREAEARLAAQEKYLDQLRHDPALVERVIRQKLGYARGDEFIFRFEDEKK